MLDHLVATACAVDRRHEETVTVTLELRPRAQLPLRLIGFVLFALGVAAVAELAWVPKVFGVGLDG